MPSSSAVNVPATFVSPEVEIVLADINTPLGDLTIGGQGSGDVTVIITASSGILYAGTFPGATVSGGGSGSLWIAGSPADVNAKLATLVYTAPTPGADTLSISVVDASGQSSGPIVVPVDVLPLRSQPCAASAALTLLGGTMTLDNRQLNGLTINIHGAQNGAGAATIILVDSTLGADATLDIASSNPASPSPRVAIAGKVELDGATTFNVGPALVTLAQNAILTNAGRLAFIDSSAQLTGAGTLRNDGIIAISGAHGPAINVAITGSGLISLAAGSHVALAGPVSADETIAFETNSGVLELSAPQSMQASITGFVAGDKIQLGEIHVDAAAYSPEGNGGTLTLYDGAQIAANLHFDGSYQLSDFVVSVATDSAADGGAISTLTVLAATHSQIIAASGQADIYRFFDTATGTQFLTQDAGERDAIVAARSDLKFEGIAMHALASPTTDPAAAPVFRFFDTVHGTHFFTADAAEKNTLLASRPDLVFEPSSTIFEHASQQAGDLPVYRFFDASNGTHFFTASAAERASILITRPDMAAEGVAFYAPGQ